MNLSSFDGSIFERAFFKSYHLARCSQTGLQDFVLRNKALMHKAAARMWKHINLQVVQLPRYSQTSQILLIVSFPVLLICARAICNNACLWISGRWQRVPLSQSCLAHLQGNCVAELPGFQEALGGWEDATLPQSASLRMLTMSVVQSLTHAKLYKVKQSAQLFMCGFSVQ